MLPCGSPSHKSPTLPKTGIFSRSRGYRWLALLPALLVASCDNPQQVDSAIEALKKREQGVVSRETSLLEHEQSLAEKERQLAESAANRPKSCPSGRDHDGNPPAILTPPRERGA